VRETGHRAGRECERWREKDSEFVSRCCPPARALPYYCQHTQSQQSPVLRRYCSARSEHRRDTFQCTESLIVHVQAPRALLGVADSSEQETTDTDTEQTVLIRAAQYPSTEHKHKHCHATRATRTQTLHAVPEHSGGGCFRGWYRDGTHSPDTTEYAPRQYRGQCEGGQCKRAIRFGVLEVAHPKAGRSDVGRVATLRQQRLHTRTKGGSRRTGQSHTHTAKSQLSIELGDDTREHNRSSGNTKRARSTKGVEGTSSRANREAQCAMNSWSRGDGRANSKRVIVWRSAMVVRV